MTLDDPTAGAATAASDANEARAQSELVARIRRGDKTAEEEFVHRFERPVLVLLRGRTGDAEASRDLAQEALLSALVAVREGRLRESERLDAFVCCTARNIALKFQRSRRRVPVSMDAIPEPAAPSFQGHSEHDERVRLIGAAIARLGEEERTVLELTWVESRSPREIAAELSLSSEVVRARKSRALKKVIDYVREQLKGPGAFRRPNP